MTRKAQITRPFILAHIAYIAPANQAREPETARMPSSLLPLMTRQETLPSFNLGPIANGWTTTLISDHRRGLDGEKAPQFTFGLGERSSF